MVEEGIGATDIPKTILDRDKNTKGFVILEKIPFHRVSKPYGIYHRENEKLSQPARVFIEECRGNRTPP